MSDAILPIAMRYLHLLCVVAAVGSILFMAVCARPAVRLLEGGLGESVLGLMEQRMNRLLGVCILGLIVSGGYNWIALASTYKAMGPIGNALIGTKVLLALVMFGVVAARSFGTIKAKPARMINLHLAAVVILLASVLRHLRLEHLQAVASAGG